MPELDGPGVCREVRKRKDHSYVYMILLTSKERKEDSRRGAGIMDLLGRELTRARRENKCTAILLGDLDHFKNINDNLWPFGRG
jgi:PleD family two-component response regulator